jgi:plastocyanin
MRSRRILVALVMTAAVFAGACGSDDAGGSDTVANDAPTTTAAAEGNGKTVEMKLIAYRPEALTVAPGTSVTWNQKDAGFHTVTSGTVEQGTGGVTEQPDGKFDSGQLATGKSFTFTFEDAGTYTYFCAVHPATMRGSVQVG